MEDNSARLAACTTVDAQRGFRLAGQWEAALDVFNVFDVKWNAIEYYYIWRLANEVAPQADYGVHPGLPRTIRARFQYYL